MEKFVYQMGISACKGVLAKSRTKLDKWISPISGRLIDSKEATTILVHTVCAHEGSKYNRNVDFNDSRMEVRTALENLPYLTDFDRDVTHKHNLSWKFFKMVLNDQAGRKLSVTEIHASYKKTISDVAIREFYTALRLYLAENEIVHKFVNRYVNRKIIIY